MTATTTRKRKRRPCACARCRGLPTADPEWGYDVADVPAKRCAGCRRPIGAEPYALDTGLGRLGQLLVYHLRCWPTAPKRCRRPGIIAATRGRP